MKIYDCCMYFDEDLILDLRLNVLNDHVDKFVVAEATRDHSGKEKKLNSMFVFEVMLREHSKLEGIWM